MSSIPHVQGLGGRRPENNVTYIKLDEWHHPFDMSGLPSLFYGNNFASPQHAGRRADDSDATPVAARPQVMCASRQTGMWPASSLSWRYRLKCVNAARCRKSLPEGDVHLVK